MTGGIDLSRVIDEFDRELVDACRVHRGRPGTADDVLDPETLELIAVDGAPVYEGRCLVTGGGTAGEEQLGQVDERVATYRLRIPLASTADIRPGDVVTVLETRWAPSLAGRRFLLVDERTASLAVSRSFTVEGRR